MTCATPVNPAFSNGAWQQHLTPLLSPENGIQIWIAHLDSFLPEEVERLFGSLDASECMRASQFHSLQDRPNPLPIRDPSRLQLPTSLQSERD
jgi:hypothetical protein